MREEATGPGRRTLRQGQVLTISWSRHDQNPRGQADTRSPLNAHATLVCPTSSRRLASPRRTGPPATCPCGWASPPPPPPPGARDPANPRARARRAEPGGRQGWAVNCTSKQKEAGRRPRGWVRAATSAGPRLGMRWAHGHSAHSNSFSPGGLASTATCL